VPLVRADVAIPSIISQKTITLCGINNNSVDFLQGKGIKRMSKVKLVNSADLSLSQ
jgi:hypothetical protein